MTDIAPDRRYSAEHEWVAAPNIDGIVRIGISAVATEALGDIVYLDLPTMDATLTAGAVCGEVESTKSVSELYAPVSGTVVAVNQAAVDDPALVNSDPYGAGWLFAVTVSAEGPLLSAEDYAAENGAA